jgi:exopolyphosphatase/guanosine-5'-triphosphate,3'-diphosphate pyrophosphatase
MGEVRVAGIDCGTNSIRLLIADVDPATGSLRDVVRWLRLVRLGQGVDATGRLAPEALERTFAAVREYAEACRAHGVTALRMVATSATRDAANADEFSDGVRRLLGVAPEVVDGIEEAELSFAGALTAVAGAAPYLVADVGGGSTELVLGAGATGAAPMVGGSAEGGWSAELVLGAATPAAAHSMDVGCVRITERHMRGDPPTPAEVAAATADVDAALDAAAAVIDLGSAATLVGVGGTVTSVTAFALGLSAYDPDIVDGTALPVPEVLAACRRLWSMTRAERQATGFLEPARADVIGAGVLVWSRLVERVAAAVAAGGGHLEKVLTSEHDILDGVALTAARRAAGNE